jgi:hypothetical protein
MRREIAPPSAKLRARVYDCLPEGLDKGPEVSFYRNPIEAFRALAAAIAGA